MYELSTMTLKDSMVRGISEDAKNAAKDVTKFANILSEAVNVDTGKLDLSKLNKGLKAANMDIPKMANSFKALGVDGVKAFAGVVK
jgi:hypothetical protein